MKVQHAGRWYDLDDEAQRAAYGRAKRLEAAQKRIAANIARRKANGPKMIEPPVVYDDVYFRGMAWLDAVAAGEIDDGLTYDPQEDALCE